MDSNLTFFSLPFVDSETSGLFKTKTEGCVYDDLQGALPPHGSLLGADDDLAQFLSADGPLEEPDLNGPTTLHCEICKKQFDNAKKYYGHLRVHSKDNLWICDKCPSQKFSTKQQLMKHSLTHKPLERVWRCPQCTMSFEALWRLQQHLFAKHLDYRTHKCDECGKSFHKPSDLKKHIEVHSDVKKHACSQCDTHFKDKSNLKRHMLTHNNDRPFCCPGCGNRFKQVASMKRHTKKCPSAAKLETVDTVVDTTIRKNYCKVCGTTFQYKSALHEHCVRQHSNSNSTNEPVPKEDKHVTNQINTDANRTVDNIVDDILSAEDDYLTMSTQTEILNVYNNNQNTTDATHDNLMQIEFLKDMNHLHSLDDELFYNDIDFDSFHTGQIFNTSDMNYGTERNEEVFFDFTECSRSIDQDIMNALYHVKAEHLPDELLNVPEADPINDKTNEETHNPTVSVNECATIFESDVDLEASTNLAANLNQLIGENTVQYISTEDDDTFIISLNSEIDAEQLTDMLNIGVEYVDDNNKTEDYSVSESDTMEQISEVEPIVVKIIEPVKPKDGNKENVDSQRSGSKAIKEKNRRKVLFVCRICNKVFTKRDNYRSHIATHEPSLRRHKCRICLESFSWRSTLNKHRAREHRRKPPPAFACRLCDKRYSAAWMLKNHIERDHEGLKPHACNRKDCGKRFYKKSDLDLHVKFHKGEREYSCDVCARAFTHVSHLKRHVRTVDCTKLVRKES